MTDISKIDIDTPITLSKTSRSYILGFIPWGSETEDVTIVTYPYPSGQHHKVSSLFDIKTYNLFRIHLGEHTTGEVVERLQDGSEFMPTADAIARRKQMVDMRIKDGFTIVLANG